MDATAPRSAERNDRFRALYDAAYVDLLRFVQRRVPPTRAEDVVADVFLVAWRRFDQVPESEDGARAWLFGVARHSMQNDTRQRGRQESLAVRIASIGLASIEAIEVDQDVIARRLDLATVWPTLSVIDQEAISLAVWDGLSAPEAATVLGITATAFRLRLSRARRSLRRHLDALDATDREHTSTTCPEGNLP